MAAEQQIHSQFFGGNRSPVRRFARDKCVDPFLCDTVNLGASAAGYNPDRLRFLRTKSKRLNFSTQRLLQFAQKLIAKNGGARLQSDQLPFLFKKSGCRS